MPEIMKPSPSPLELQLMQKRAERAMVAALRELDGAPDEPALAAMTATLLLVHGLQAVATLDSEVKALRMLAGFQSDVAVKVLNALRAARALLETPAGQA
jgi:hypothetical protein